MFTRLSIPTPFQIGPVNAYLSGRTLVDPGPGSEEAWTALLEGLEGNGMGPTDIEQVLVTHPHPDHFGLAKRLREAGARVVASHDTASIIRDFVSRLEYEQSYFADFFDKSGMARTTAETVTNLPEAYLSVSPGVETDLELADGESVTVDGVDLTAESVQGHAPGETIFTFEESGKSKAIVGDHVLADITPNPLLQPPMETGGNRPRVLPAFNRSLSELRERELDYIFPGHREEIGNPTGRIGEILEAHEDRTENVRELVEGPTTAFDVMEGLFDDLPATEYFPGMSEAVGHLDVLEERGDVSRQEQGGVVMYEEVSA
ncbi:Glyoxylase, beta-lactamase superfamily II [Haladaptatus litoreus]|uniref:Glyoxylase, beta-lactamase superfamily II n=1 Tax=Haladaptatus litoreus TaxID=553468 RepID=A0A1N6YME2_9EURY|nr:MBL fold metallo-hydrolase [Haladaptatus litoreus]SIR15780.1 Glyoxylase, beta-lactamase superfamily II [Haladaptatus litoreus]